MFVTLKQVKEIAHNAVQRMVDKRVAKIKRRLIDPVQSRVGELEKKLELMESYHKIELVETEGRAYQKIKK